MAFKELLSLEADTTISLGGTDRKTGKVNPTKIEGYFIGTKLIASSKAKDGFSRLHILQTAKGNVGVWGKTNLNQKLLSVAAGTMVRITQSGKQNTPNGEMYLYKVEHDESNTIEVDFAPKNKAVVSEEEPVEASAVADDEFEETSLDAEESYDEVPYTPPTAPKKAVATPDAERAARVQALLKSRSNNRLS